MIQKIRNYFAARKVRVLDMRVTILKDQLWAAKEHARRVESEKTILFNDFQALWDDHAHLQVAYKNLQFARLQDYKLDRLPVDAKV